MFCIISRHLFCDSNPPGLQGFLLPFSIHRYGHFTVVKILFCPQPQALIFCVIKRIGNLRFPVIEKSAFFFWHTVFIRNICLCQNMILRYQGNSHLAFRRPLKAHVKLVPFRMIDFNQGITLPAYLSGIFRCKVGFQTAYGGSAG